MSDRPPPSPENAAKYDSAAAVIAEGRIYTTNMPDSADVNETMDEARHYLSETYSINVGLGAASGGPSGWTLTITGA